MMHSFRFHFIKIFPYFFPLTFSFCDHLQGKPVEIHAVAATPLPPSNSDVMDDPAIWVNKRNPSESLVLGTNKKQPLAGLYIYKLSGKFKGSVPVGPLNNVDVRTNFYYNGKLIDIAVATATNEKKLAFFSIDPQTGKILFMDFSAHTFEHVPYGFCLMKEGKKFYAVLTFKKGGAQKWEFWEEQGKLHMKKVESYPIKTQAEGCVANDEEGTLFMTEEGKGIWVFKKGEEPEIIAKVGEHDLVADLEGLALYKDKYLIVSSQGNSTYAVFEAKAPYTYRGAFKISASKTQEGTEETDGIAVVAANLEGLFTKGLFVAHDNRSSKGGASNFKFVPWAEIAQKLGLDY